MIGSPRCHRPSSPIVSHDGYTLVELLVAVTILSISLIGIMSAISVSQDTQDRALHMALARDIAINEMERYRALGAASVMTLTPTYTSSALPRGNTVTRSVTQYPNAGPTTLYRAAITVSWPEANSTRSITYDTLLYKP